MDFAGGSSKAKAWKDIWGAGQGVGGVHEVVPTAELIARLKREYDEAKRGLCAG
jgi:nitronate monooxygenase